jgi:hypothetical protein
MDLQLVWELHSDILGWVLYLGGNSAADQVERPWFVSQLARGVMAVDPKCWEKMRALLLKYLYLDRAHQYSFQVVWSEGQKVAQALS